MTGFELWTFLFVYQWLFHMSLPPNVWELVFIEVASDTIQTYLSLLGKNGPPRSLFVYFAFSNKQYNFYNKSM